MKGSQVISALRQLTGHAHAPLEDSPERRVDVGIGSHHIFSDILRLREAIADLDIKRLVIALDATEETITRAKQKDADLFLFANDHIHHNETFQRILGDLKAWCEHMEMVVSRHGLSARLAQKIFPEIEVPFHQGIFVGQLISVPTYEVKMSRDGVLEKVRIVFPDATAIHPEGRGKDPEKIIVKVIAGSGGVPAALETKPTPNGIVTGRISEYYRTVFLEKAQEKGVSTFCVSPDTDANTCDEGRRESELIGLRDIVEELRKMLDEVEIVFLDK